MGQRFSDIRRAAKLSQQLTGYLAYLQNPKSLTAAYKPRGKRVLAQLLPFGGGVKTGEFAAASYEDKPENAALVAKVNVVAEIVPRTTNAKQFVGFRPARVTRVTSTTKTTTEQTSKYTNVKYRKYTADRGAVPFGAKTAGDEYLDIIELLKPSLQESTFEICWVSFTPESKAGR